MDENKLNPVNEEAVEEMEETVDENMVFTLVDENGKEVQFEMLDMVPYGGKDYMVVVPVEEGDGGVVVFAVSEDEDADELYTVVEDDALGEKVFNAFRARHPELKYKD